MNDDFLITKIHQVVLVGKEKYPDKKLIFNNTLHYNELIFHFSGLATVYFGNTVIKTEKNTVRFLPKGDVSRYEVVRDTIGECIDVFFDTDKPVSIDAFAINANHKEHIGLLFKKMFSVWISKEDGYYFECISLLNKIFSELQKRNYLSHELYSKIKPAIDEINKDFLSKDLSSAYLASVCNISESYLKKLFKKKFGVPPKRYIIQKKINYACELLLLGRYSINQIAELCNFSDVYYFSKQFKEQMGVSPTEYIKKHKS